VLGFRSPEGCTALSQFPHLLVVPQTNGRKGELTWQKL
jgi:hypothetical protein